MGRFSRFLYGRYGNDKLNTFLLVLYLILSLIYIITNLMILWIVSVFPILFALLRMLSRNIAKRQAENQMFLKLWRPVSRFFRNTKKRMGDKAHRYYKCPGCKAMLRVPRNAGKIVITCPVCKCKVEKKT